MCYDGTTSLTFAFFYFLVCKTRETAWAPVDWCVCFISQAFFVELKENPLSPFVVVRAASDYLTIPVVAETERLNLLCEVCDILVSGSSRVSACFDSIVFGWKTERIISHRMKDIVAVHAQKS